jgi:hypothetical protein
MGVVKDYITGEEEERREYSFVFEGSTDPL